MPNYSTHKKLELPLSTEKYSVAVTNKNNTIIDSELHKLEQKNQSQDSLLATKEALQAHTNNQLNPHGVTKLQVGLGNVENKSSAVIRSELTEQNVTAALGYKPYTPAEIADQLSLLEAELDWKKSVETFADIAAAYPNPQDGWTVTVRDTDYTYRFNGSSWIAISANALPKATDGTDGLLSKEDHKRYEEAYAQKHDHENQTVLDGITPESVANWNSAHEYSISGHTHSLVSQEADGFCPQLTGTGLKYLRDDGTWEAPKGSSGDAELLKRIEDLEKNELLYQDVSIGDVTIPTYRGYEPITVPPIGHTCLFATIATWRNNSDAFLVQGNNRSFYLAGTPGTVVTGLILRIWYRRGS
ncbi:MAG: hypothetical protein HFI30_16815 [Lachnospiraceae bacterium]|nr:hypothetical protein [Lachnospiraceae bacterium]